MSKKAKNKIVRKNWVSNFSLTGEAVINEFTFKVGEVSEKSKYQYNSLNLGVNCGEKHGTVYANMMGGFYEGKENETYIYAHKKSEDGSDDFSEDGKMKIAWEDRNNEEILRNVGELCFVTVGLEVNKTKIIYKKFLSPYDAVIYLQEHLKNGMVINVRGALKFNFYNDEIKVQKNINRIVLSKVDDPAKYKAEFTQSVLLDKESVSLEKDRIDKEKGIIYLGTRIFDYVNTLDGVEIKGQYPFRREFEFEINFDEKEKFDKIINNFLKVKKNVTQINFVGSFVCGGAVVKATWDDVPEDIKSLVDYGVFTREEALAKCSSNGKREERMVLLRPDIKLVGDEKTPCLQKFDELYKEEDLNIDIVDDTPEETQADKNGFMELPDGEEDEFPFNTDSWLDGIQ